MRVACIGQIQQSAQPRPSQAPGPAVQAEKRIANCALARLAMHRHGHAAIAAGVPAHTLYTCRKYYIYIPLPTLILTVRIRISDASAMSL